MVKEVNGFELSKSIKYKYSVRVRFYPSAKTSCLHDHVKPVIWNQEPDHIILHIGTNDLLSDKTQYKFAMTLWILLCQVNTKI